MSKRLTEERVRKIVDERVSDRICKAFGIPLGVDLSKPTKCMVFMYEDVDF